MSADAEIYIVRAGDTLGAIARAHGTTTAKLVDINDIRNPDWLSVGQRIAIREKQMCSIVPLFIDRDRNPIQGLSYRLESTGMEVFEGTSQQNGLGERFICKEQGDIVRVSVRRVNGTWKAISKVEARTGEKLVTLRSGKVKIRTRTEPHPMTSDSVPVNDQVSKTIPTTVLPGTPKIAKGTMQSSVANGQNPGIKALADKTPQGAFVTRVSKDLPDLQKYFATYTGEAITDQDWSVAAGIIGCEIPVIKAFAHVESHGAGFDKQNRPVILYERHVFSRRTNHEFDSKNADISSPKAYTVATVDVQKHTIADSDRYGAQGTHQYERFEKAYTLDAQGAIQACSWGKFQILGENYINQFRSPEDFLRAACTSERRHLLDLFVPFVRAKKSSKLGTLQDALIQKNWVNAAYLYNGSGYKKYNYDNKLKEAYEKIKSGVWTV
jgi:LysM repeat protein